MRGRRRRRWGERERNSLLPLERTRHISNTLSCWYCDFKIFALNASLFSFGRKHARCLRGWFSMGVGFSLTALVGVTLILLWETACALHLYNGNIQLKNLWTSLLLGFSPSVPGLSLSFADTVYLIISTLISVTVHEFGHAISAASEGIQIEYIAVFLAVLFPGALVALNYEVLQNLPHFAALRLYCAGIWHNALCCAVCAFALFLMPLILCPLYVYGQGPMVLSVSSTSPLSGYLSFGDVIVSLDGLDIHNPQEWIEMISLFNEQTSQNPNRSKETSTFAAAGGKKGYCVPNLLMEKNVKIQSGDDWIPCPDELMEFVTVPCLNSSFSDDDNREGHGIRIESYHCLTAKNVVKLKKCGDGWPITETSGSSCICSQDESCLTPVQKSGLTWVEISYSSPYSSKCLQHGVNSSTDIESTESGAINCGGTFVFVGDVLSVAHSVKLTAYRPRWAFLFGAYFPTILEKMLACTFHVSITLALLNSLPVFFLDGESILEATLCHITLLSPKKRGQILQICLFGGTISSILAFLRIFLSILSEANGSSIVRYNL